MSVTKKALMARGLDEESARKLQSVGWTIAKLKEASREDLEKTGLRADFIDAVFAESRPAIPIKTLTRLLFANRYQCCICREGSRAIVIHHIEEWSISRSHDMDNLAVLCLDHHDQAHTRKQISQNLDSRTVKEFKREWEEKVRKRDSESINAAMRLKYSTWNYINELRLFEIANELEIEFDKTDYFSAALSSGAIGVDGIPLGVDEVKLFYKYSGTNNISRYLYVSSVLTEVIKRIEVANISDSLDRGVLSEVVVPGDFIFVQGAHVFSPVSHKKNGLGRGQISEGVRRANSVEVRFTFDRWEATSSSAKVCWLTGTRNQGSLVQVKDLSRSDGRLVIRGTVIGICSNLGDLKTREYAHRWLEWIPRADYGGDEEVDARGRD